MVRQPHVEPGIACGYAAILIGDTCSPVRLGELRHALADLGVSWERYVSRMRQRIAHKCTRARRVACRHRSQTAVCPDEADHTASDFEGLARQLESGASIRRIGPSES
jgi:hypothetical protein